MATPGSLDDLVREVQALHSQQSTALNAAAAAMLASDAVRGLAFPIGTKVLDLVTGQQGVVVNGKRENVVIPSSANNGG